MRNRPENGSLTHQFDERAVVFYHRGSAPFRRKSEAGHLKPFTGSRKRRTFLHMRPSKRGRVVTPRESMDAHAIDIPTESRTIRWRHSRTSGERRTSMILQCSPFSPSLVFSFFSFFSSYKYVQESHTPCPTPTGFRR